MDNNNRLQLEKGTEPYKLTVTQDLEKKIRFLCEKLPRNEWSGTLFYTVEGSFADKNLHIICKDFFLQDVGEATYTEFKNDVELAGYIAAHELWDCYMGLMHSHQNFSTFFSGTDLATLKEEGNDNNHFVSLIVNNAGKYTAAITRKVNSKSTGQVSLSYNTFGNVPVSEEPYDFEEDYSYIEYYTLEIEIESIPVTPKSELELRLEEVRKSANSYINRPLNTSFKDYMPISSLEKEPKYVQNTLFSPEEMGEKPVKEIELDGDIPYGSVRFNSDVINKAVTQIITGDIFSIYKTNIDLSKWANNMPVLYEKRFGKDLKDSAFSYWVDSLIEVLEEEANDESLAKEGRDYLDAIWAYDIIEKLETFPRNAYLDMFIDSLQRWLI